MNRNRSDHRFNLNLICLIFSGLVLGCMTPGDSRRSSAGNQRQSDETVSPSAPTTSQTSTWTYSKHSDEMGRGSIYTASVKSLHPISLDFPYQGDQFANLTIRKHPQHGNDVIISIEKGQLLESDYNEKVKVRFDEGKLMSFESVRPSDHSSETLFLQGAFAKFLSQLKTAKTLKVEVPVYQNGNLILVFDVRDFSWKP